VCQLKQLSYLGVCLLDKKKGGPSTGWTALSTKLQKRCKAKWIMQQEQASEPAQEPALPAACH
jgi:hypothetical protein